MHDLDDVAQSQFGLVTHHQAVESLGSWGCRRALRSGGLILMAGGVYRLPGTAPSFRQRALASCLAYGPPVALSHRSAAALWGYEAVNPGPEIEVSIGHGRSGRRAGIRAHRVTVSDADLATRYMIPVTGPGRTLLDLAAGVTASVLERCVDDALRARQATANELLEWLAQEDRRGRRGASRLKQLLAVRVASGTGDSVGVDRVFRWIARAGLPPPVLGFPVIVAGRQRLLDLAYPAEKVAIEFNGWEFHQMRSRMDDDHARTTELELAGWLVIVVTAAHHEAETIDRIERALALRSPRRTPALPSPRHSRSPSPGRPREAATVRVTARREASWNDHL